MAHRSHVMICTCTNCISNGALKIKDALEKELGERQLTDDILVVQTGASGLCVKGPILMVQPDGIFYQYLKETDVPNLVEEHFLKGRPVEALMFVSQGEDIPIPRLQDIPFFKDQRLIALRNRGLIDPDNLDEYIANDGYKALAKVITSMTPEAVIDEMQKSGLRGRGGAGFPAGRKWGFCRSYVLKQRAVQPDMPCYVICNADEGDPGAFMDRSILEADPHSVIEGMTIGAYAMGGTHGYIYVRAEYPLAIRRMIQAIEQAREHGLLGKDILGSGFNFDLTVFHGAGAFVCGEETSLIHSIEGLPPEPTQKPPFPAESGLWNGPTNINNVETWANVAAIINSGAEWFKKIGTETSPGTKVFSLAGNINNAGLVEVPMGITLREMIYDIGGGIPYNKKLKGIQTGGPSGGVIPASLLHLSVDYERLKEAGAIMGSGGMIVMDEDTCMVDLAKYFLEFTADESCGKCSSCREGAQALYEILSKICRGDGEMSDLDLLEEISEAVKDASMCGLGQTLPNPILSSLKYFRDEYIEHIKYKRCRAGICKQIMSSSCQHACPLDQDVPCYVGLVAQRKFEDAIRIIRQKNPLPAVCGRVCTHPCESKCKAGVGGGKPIHIKALKRFLADYEMKEGLSVDVEAKPKNGKKVAVIGAGPAGLSAGYYLALHGYEVVILEALPVAGGMLAVGIPRYRLPKDILDYEIEIIRKAGVEIRTGTKVGRDVAFEDLQKNYDAVLIATGAHAGLKLGIPGEDIEGVIDAVDFLRKVTLGETVELGQKVMVIGGGNAAIDAARTARRLGKDVTICYRRTKMQMPAIEEEVHEAILEGVTIDYLVAPVKAVAANGKLKGVELIRMQLGEFDKSGRPRPVPVEGSESVVDVDTLIPAISQEPDVASMIGRSKLKLTKWNSVEADAETFYTGVDGVFACGDVVSGPDTVTTALANGRTAAQMIDKYVKGEPLQRTYAVTRPLIRVEAVTLTEEETAAMKPAEIPVIGVTERALNFDEVEQAFTEETAVREAKRCYRCDLELSEGEPRSNA
ncbi:MAG: FAD-dependent oxidoreductase [Phycisphaerae bacterium]|nr:FAD-dependent oxidoreductase [Phycisphaerae bacterium]